MSEGRPQVSGPAPKRVPAVQNALAILDLLASVGNDPRTLSEIAWAADLNGSTCFNILKTLQGGGLISFDPARKTYRLGLRLAELGALVDGRAEAAQLVLEEARRVAEQVALSCFLLGLDRGEAFIVLDKVESTRPIRVTIDAGARFPLTGAVAAKAWFAWASRAAVAELMERHDLPHRTERSITEPARFEAELATTRARGYSTSLGEYYPGHNAVSAAVFGADGAPCFLLVVVGTSDELAGAALARVGEEVSAAADRATKRIGGRHPAWSQPSPG